MSSKFAVGMVDLFANNSEGEPFNYFLLTAFVTPKKMITKDIYGNHNFS
ncbi:hypothetical protein ENHY17A_30127 [Moraxellaceae bacterium 17A]|nr:hypothetical protein ENHY17A_30127 [Moraxellaceae bacterium 17A]